MTTLPVVAVTMGDPAGIGPELAVQALAAVDWCVPVVVGDVDRLRMAVDVCGGDCSVVAVASPGAAAEVPAGVVACLDLANVPPALPFGQLSADAGQAAYEYVREAVRLAQSGSIDAICTLPLNKAALHAAGHRYPGHTELLAELTGTPEVSMMLDADSFKVVHVTTHLGLLDAVERIEPELVLRTLRRADEVLRIGDDGPSIAVCGINPHAGEGGLFGRGEERDKIEPAVARAREEGLRVEGPLPADTLFFRARRGDFDVVVAMYHDQGHGPVKVLGLEHGVNVTLGLPVVRTSVDHGTAFDIAGTGRAGTGSLLRALRVAVQLSTRRAV